ncbi:hypothetical protein JRC04_04845 [Mycolicibacterium sp. S2-37]|uniref:hypothetical protein n=1 Tax=Mycolicibacterium sp. S2-37 TaxID=2810297 RepID=UPI001A9416E0|nr:hypothetical protein [Mycolicibacterium sp. S2-37]MBO0676787.1 hypothetical protein [Mycolicibacterium sp. S2-37]
MRNLSFGNQTITVVKVGENPTDRDRYNRPAEIHTETAVPGCRVRPAGSQSNPATKEKVTEVGDIASEQWKVTAPPAPALLAATARDKIEVNGITYQIVGGVRPFVDMRGNAFKVTVFIEKFTP